MTLIGGDISNRAVAMLGVVPAHKRRDPTTSYLAARERETGIRRRVFECAKQRFRIRVVVTHVRATKRRDDAQPLQGGDHRVSVMGFPLSECKTRPFGSTPPSM